MVKSIFTIFALMLFGLTANAQIPFDPDQDSNFPNDRNNPNQDYRGYLGVLVSPADFGGMVIEGFIKNTPASKLNAGGSIRRGDVITRLAGRNITGLRSLTRARDSIPFGAEGKMVLRDQAGQYYFVWISRKNPAVARALAARGATRAEIQTKTSDTFSYGGKGMGEGQADIRDPETKQPVQALRENQSARSNVESSDDTYDNDQVVVDPEAEDNSEIRPGPASE